MSKFTSSNLASRRNARRERVDVKHHPEVFEPTEEQALTADLAVNAAKASPAYYDLSDAFSLQVQQQRGGGL